VTSLLAQYSALDADVVRLLLQHHRHDTARLHEQLADMQRQSDAQAARARVQALAQRLGADGELVAVLVAEGHSDADIAQMLRAAADADAGSDAADPAPPSASSDRAALAALQATWSARVEADIVALLWDECDGDVAQVETVLRAIAAEPREAAEGKEEKKKEKEEKEEKGREEKAASAEGLAFLRGVFAEVDASFLESLLVAADNDAQAVTQALWSLIDAADSDDDAEEGKAHAPDSEEKESDALTADALGTPSFSSFTSLPSVPSLPSFLLFLSSLTLSQRVSSPSSRARRSPRWRRSRSSVRTWTRAHSSRRSRPRRATCAPLPSISLHLPSISSHLLIASLSSRSRRSSCSAGV
jgi:hypothetical protein